MAHQISQADACTHRLYLGIQSSGERHMDKLERLVAIEDIKNLKARYLRCADSKQWDEFETLFTPDAEFIGHDVGDFRVKGTRQFREYSEKFLADCQSVHHVLAPEITFLDD